MSLFGVRVEDLSDRWLAVVETSDVGTAKAVFVKADWQRDDIPVIMVRMIEQERLKRDVAAMVEELKHARS